MSWADLAATGRVVRYVRAKLSATGRAVHGPSCPGIEPDLSLWRRTCGHMAFSFMPYDMYQTSLRIRFKFQGDPCSIKEVMTEKQRRPPFKICPFYVIYTNGNWINSCVHICLLYTKPFPLVHYTINKQRRCHFCFLWSYLVIYKKIFFKMLRKWLLKFHEIFGLILFCWPYFSFLNAYSCVVRQNNASKFYFTFLSHHIFAYFFKIQGIKRWHILLNKWQIFISETSVKSLNYLDSVGIKKKDWCLTKLFYTARVPLKIFELKFQSIKKQRCAKIKNSALKFKIDQRLYKVINVVFLVIFGHVIHN